MARMDVAEATKGAEALVGLALAEHVDEQHRAGAGERTRLANVLNAATWTAEHTFGRPASEMIGWTVTPRESAPAQVAEAVVCLVHDPYPMALVFRATQDDDASFMADHGALFVRGECHICYAEHVIRVDTLAELGAILTAHSSGETGTPHGAPPTPPAEWSLPADPRSE
jgi:hypothetical protein